MALVFTAEIEPVIDSLGAVPYATIITSSRDTASYSICTFTTLLLPIATSSVL
ncbi:hypothetical protein SDC9_68771 [bioreactor metagenome]|uniref:Uncharacterized protein n=1 Tax=bioreactor metagenome TaxID=1076179 RepID=A0A644Y1U1_9ZZZZ